MHRLIHQLLINIAVPIRIKILKKIETRQHWTPREIKAYQTQKLIKIIHYCWEHVPFYKQKWQPFISGPSEIKNIEDLVKLPILTKDDVKNSLEALTTSDKTIKYSEARTGGSTGRPIIFRMTKFDEEMSWAQMYMGWKWSGYRVGAPFLVVGGESVGTGIDDNRTWKDFVINRWVTSASNLTLERTKALIASRHFNKIEMIYGYPNAIKELGEMLAKLDKKPPKLRGIVCTAEVMRPEVRVRIQQIYGVKVLDQYGLNDGGLHACESREQQGLNLSFHRGVLEIIDQNGNQIQEANKSGKAIASCFTNFAMPLIRYETGDNLHWLEDQITSNVKWKKLGPVDGRTGDILVMPSGRIITMPGITLVMRWLEGLKQYQFIQRTQYNVDVHLDTYDEFSQSIEDITQFLNDKITDEVNWQILFKAPELTKNDKILIIRNDFLSAKQAENTVD